MPDRLELYLDGELVAAAPADPGEATNPCRLLVGRLKTAAQPGLDQVRPFVGRHHELGTAARP
ncbi:MAG: hypothetical protein C0501_19130 [Isosphaera sp.]|nr:hypothetical protein [Isosphaera sp.]